MTPYVPIRSSGSNILEMQWFEVPIITRRRWYVFLSILSLFSALVILAFFLVITEMLFGSLNGFPWITGVIISILISHSIVLRWGQKDYRYGGFITNIPFSINTSDKEPKEFFQQLFDEVFKLSNPHRTIEDKKYYTDLIYTFDSSTCSLEIIIPNKNDPEGHTSLTLIAIEKEDMPRLLEIKELVGMALGIADPEE